MKKFYSLFLISALTLLFGQTNNRRWQDLFSYNDVKIIKEIENELYCATENGIFVYHPSQDEFLKLNKTNYLNQVELTAMDYNPNTKDLIIGYNNGSLDIFNIETKKTKAVLDIPWNRYTGSKKVNDILIVNNIAFIASSFGIVSYDLTLNEFKETTFFFNNQYQEVNKLTIHNNRLYALNNRNLFYYDLKDNLNTPDFTKWNTINLNSVDNSDFKNIILYQNEIYLANVNNLYKLNSSNQIVIQNQYNTIKDLKVLNNSIAIVQENQINFYNSSNPLFLIIENSNNKRVQLNTAVYFENNYYAGTKEFGITKFTQSAFNSETDAIKPDGPYNNQSYSVTAKNQKVWIAPGGMTNFNEPQSNSNGFYYFDRFKWNHFLSEDLLEAKDFIKIAVDPKDDNHFVAIPYFESPGWNNSQRIGYFDITFNNGTYRYNHVTNPLNWLYRIGGAEFDESGTLYLSTSFPDTKQTANYYYQLQNNTWKTSLISTKDDSSTSLNPAISSNYIWFPNARGGGLTVLDKNMNEVITLTKSNSNIYDNAVLTAAVDNNNEVWIGTLSGLTILRGGDQAIASGNYKTEPIIITQNGITEALLTSIRINSIKVDKANRKWIATNSSGVYYVSENGDQTIHHFTSKNSPLPSDIIYDIAIDNMNGKVYFATEKGVVVFNGDVQDIGTNFNKAIVYPNPVRPNYNGIVTIKNLPERSSVKITDITGNLLFESKSSGGIVEWNTKNSKGKDVASGIYLILMTNPDGSETKTLKLAIVR